jgi:hypothetical protein
MQSDAKRDEYRRMTPAERLRLTFDLIEEGWRYLNVGTEEQVRKKYQRIHEENDLFNRRVLEGLARTKKASS